MGDKRESLKKSLGITEYPWSTDEEDNDAQPQPSTSAPNISVVMAMNHLVPPTSQPSTSTASTSSGQVGEPGPSSSTASGSQHRSRVERNLFWSLLQSPKHVDFQTRPRCSDEQHHHTIRPSQVSRLPTTPDPLLKNLKSPLKEIRDLLAIKKAARYAAISHSRSKAAQAAVSLHRSGHVLPSKNPLFTAGQSIDSRIKRTQSNHTPAPSSTDHARSSSTSNMIDFAEQPSTSSGVTRCRYNFVGSPQRNDTSVEECMVLDNDTDDDIPESPQHRSKETDQSLENASGSGVADASVSLEEEVLVVEPVVELPSDGGEPDAAGDGDAPPRDHSNAPVTSTPNIQQDDESQTSRRKRETEESFKELNTSLLRLLECPVCMEWMEPPMSQCRRGHLVCVRCRARLAACPVCRTAFSSVRNRAMEGVAEMLRYPCRHGCGREVRVRRRASHEANCAHRRYACPAPACAARPPLARALLPQHLQTKHLSMLKIGRKQKFTVKVNSEQHDNWIMTAFHEIFHLKIDVDIRTWGITIYVSYIGPKKCSKNFLYEVSIEGKHNGRKLVYSRTTHSDLESAPLNVSRHDCFHLSLDQALNFLRVKNRHFESDNLLNINIAVSRNETIEQREDSYDS